MEFRSARGDILAPESYGIYIILINANYPSPHQIGGDVKFKKIEPPKDGTQIKIVGKKLKIPNDPIIPVIEGDGIGADIMRATRRVVDAAVEKTYQGMKRIAWFDIYAGDAARERYDEYLPKDTLDAIKTYIVALKGPLTTPIGGGFRSLNVTLRQVLDLYACV
ncbi:MAG TPA: hypothetical protein DEO84_05950, partial [candidate division Zixibacteria bacterium]|nr:hypothetical protein [candidate division Zixibacteria bacterium]